jgi:carbamoyl-phosphate synthase large subunit
LGLKPLTTKNPFNVLITSLSNKVPLVREVRKALKKIDANGRIFGADCNPSCIGRHFVDEFWEMPPTDGLDPEKIVNFCKAGDIQAVIPTRDDELLFFAKNKGLFNTKGIAVMIASPESVHTCLDKKEFFYALSNKNGLNTIVTFDHPDQDYGGRWVVKERYGSGSENMLLDVSVEAGRSSLSRFENPVWQPYIEGQESSVDIFIAQNATPKGCIVRTRDVVIHGESQVSTTADRPDIEKICLEAAAIIGLTGHVLFQLIEDAQGSLNILECNCRFGGASSLSVAAGLDSFYWFSRECLGDDLSDVSFLHSRAGLRQIRYAEDKVVQMTKRLNHREHREPREY